MEAGVVNQNWWVDCANGKLILRKTTFSKRKQVEFELEYLDYLKTNGFPYEIPSPILTNGGERFVDRQGSIFWMYRYIRGSAQVKGELTPIQVKEVARMMASYHSLIEVSRLNNGASPSDVLNKSVVLRELRHFQSSLPDNGDLSNKDRIFLRESSKLISLLEAQVIDPRLASRLKRFPIHRDIGPGNIIWRHGKLVGLIDFENVGQHNDPLVKDIAVFFQYGCRKERYKFDLDLCEAFLKEYTKHRSISSSEVGLIPSLEVSGFVEDFSYAYWMVRNDPRRAGAYRLKLYSKAAQWYDRNMNETIEVLSKYARNGS